MSSSSNVSSQPTDPNGVNPFYAHYKDAGFSPELAIVGTCYALMAIFGISLNSSIIWITLRNREKGSTFRSNVNVLVACNSLYDVCHQSGHFVFCWVLVSGRNFVPIASVFWPLLPSLVGTFGACILITCIAFDRFLAIVAPVTYWKMKKWTLIVAYLCATNVLTAFIVVGTGLCVQYSPATPSSLAAAAAYWTTSAIYVCLLMALKCRKTNLSNPVAIQRLHKSVLYVISSDYRDAYERAFPLLKRMRTALTKQTTSTTVVVPLSNVGASAIHIVPYTI